MPTQKSPTTQIYGQLTRYTETAFQVEQWDDEVAITTPFIYPYDDPITLYLHHTDDGLCLISDHGKTLNWLITVNGLANDWELSPSDRAFWDDNCEFYATRRSDSDCLEIDVDPGNLAPTAFRLLQTIIHILGPEPRYDD